MDLTDVSAIVTGGASGIGAAAAEQLAEQGAKVVSADLQEDKGNVLAGKIGGAFCKVDVTNTDDIVKLGLTREWQKGGNRGLVAGTRKEAFALWD